MERRMEMLRRTLVCKACGGEWDKTGEVCKASVNELHSFIEKEIPCEDNTGYSVVVCRLCRGVLCGEEWNIDKSPCRYSANGRHENCKVEFDKAGFEKYQK